MHKHTTGKQDQIIANAESMPLSKQGNETIENLLDIIKSLDDQITQLKDLVKQEAESARRVERVRRVYGVG